MKKIACVLLAFLFVSFVTACKGKSVTTPIYQGMEITQSEPKVANTNNVKNLGFVKLTTNDDDDGMQIEEPSQTLTIEGGNYYAGKNQDIKIHIKIKNPDNYEILSFILNGYRYQSFEFEDGSNSTDLFLTVSTDDVPGLKEFTIDNIKYVEGTDIKDVIIDGNETVTVTVYKDLPNVSLDTNEDYASISGNVSILDNDSALKEDSTKIRLMDGDLLVRETTDLDFNFDILSSNKDYRIDIVSTIDILDSNGEREVVLFSQNVKTKEVLIDIVVGQNKIDFNVLVNDDNNRIDMSTLKVNLYKDGFVIDTITLVELTKTGLFFDELLSNNEYVIKLEADYDLNDGIGVQSIVLGETTQTTLTKEIPTGTISNIVIGQKDITLDINIADYDLVIDMSTLKVNLYKDGIVIDTITLAELTKTGLFFDKLLTNNEYVIKLEADYDLNDGIGVQSIVLGETTPQTTLTKEIPTGTISNIVIGQEDITLDINIADYDLVIDMSTLKVNLYKDGIVIDTITLAELTKTGLTFDYLLTNNEYVIKLEVDYDLYDGNGVQNIVLAETTKKTITSNFDITSIKSMNDNANQNEEIEVIIDLYNPENIDIKSVIINGIEYSEFLSIMSARILLKVNVGEIIGDVDLTIERINITNNGYIDKLTQNTLSLFVSGDLKFKSIELEKGIPVILSNEELIINVNLDNPNNYQYSYVIINGIKYTNFYEVSQNSVSIKYTNIGNQDIKFEVSEYGFVVQNKELSRSIVKDNTINVYYVYRVNYYSIYTVEDLISIQKNDNYREYNVYLLQNDIDLTGINWVPLTLQKSLFDGRGYKISNVNITQFLNTDDNANIGFFESINYSEVRNLFLENINIDITNLGNANMIIGGLVGHSYEGTIKNSHITGDIIIAGESIQGEVGGLVGYNHVGKIDYSSADVTINSVINAGGLVGYNYYGTITNSYATGNVSSSGAYNGGLVGYNYGTITNSYATGNVSSSGACNGGLVGWNSREITNSYATGNVSSSGAYSGGLVGSNSGEITNSYATGDVSVSSRVSYSDSGGLVGYNSGEITNSYATGNVSSSVSYSDVGGLVGSNYTSGEITNSFRLDTQIIKINDIVSEPSDKSLEGVNVVTTTNLNEQSWYKDVLGFDTNIWDLNEVNNENTFPILITN